MREPISIGILVSFLAGCVPLTDAEETDTTPVIISSEIEVQSDRRCFAFQQNAVTPAPFSALAIIAPMDDESGISPAPSRDPALPTEDAPTRFETLCPPNFTPDFVASLQRALAARDAYTGPINGKYDAATGEAVRIYQLPSGINSPALSIATARSLGLVILSAAEIEDLNRS